MKSRFLIFAVLAILKSAAAVKILFLNGIPSPSHHLFNRVLVLELAEKGHNVTFLSVDVVKKVVPNVHYIHLEKVYEILFDDGARNVLSFVDQTPQQAVVEFPGVVLATCAGILASDGLDKILDYPDNFFDLVIYDFTFGPCLVPLVAKFNYPPLVSVSAFANPPDTVDIVGGQNYPSYVPHYAVDYDSDMTFSQRFFNTYLYFLDSLVHKFVLYPALNRQTREKFKFDYPPIEEIQQRTALILVNTNNAIDFPEPLQPNMIQIGGLQIAEAKPLPEEIENFIKSGKKGTVLMSLGTNIKSNQLGYDKLEKILKTFAQIPDYNFIWKFESEVEDLPIAPSKNVMIGKFLPQNDILAHQNIVAFISHAGMLSTHESLWHGKPIIGIPFFFDQHRTLGKAIRNGVAVKADFRNLSPEVFEPIIMEVLGNPKFAEKAQKISKLFRDKPQKPLDVAVWWIEYVIRNPDLEFLKSPTLKLGPFVTRSYDALLVLIILLHIFVFVLVKAIKCLARVTGLSKKSKKKEE